MTNIDTNQMDNQINPQDLALYEQKVSNEAELEEAKKKESSVVVSKAEDSLINKQALTSDSKLDSKEEVFKKYAMKKEEEIAESKLKTTLDCFSAESQKLINDLRSTAQEIKKEGYFLGLLPEKTAEHLVNLIPQISQELHKRIIEDFDHQLELRSIKLTEVSQRLEAKCNSINQSLNDTYSKQLENLNKLNEVYEQAQNASVKKKIMSYVASTTLLIFIALSSCWTMFKYFPSKVLINEGSNVTVEGSNVTVWSRDYKILDKVSNKEGSRPLRK